MNTTKMPPPQSEKTRWLRVFKWAIINGGLAFVAWLAFGGSVGAGRILSFTLWLCAVLTLAGAASDDVKAKAAVQGRSIPAWLSRLVGFSMILALVWHGWWLTTFAYLLIEFGELVIFHDLDNRKEVKP